jgi:hypothetical protein
VVDSGYCWSIWPGMPKLPFEAKENDSVMLKKPMITYWLVRKGGTDVRKCTLVILCMLLASIGMAYSAGATEVKITNPPDGAIVSKNVDIGLTSKDIPAGQDYWICVYPIDVKRYYIQDKRHSPIGMTITGKQSTEALIGTDEDSGIKFKLLAIVADKNAIKTIMSYLDQSNARGSWLGLEKLPDGAKIFDEITVTRR